MQATQKIFINFCVLVTLACYVRAQFINEIHYDNVAKDEGESVEIVAPAGMSLAGYSLALYDGMTGMIYGTVPISGSVSDQCHGWGFITVVFPSDGIQNGAPDGLALIDNNGNVVEFLSYEGTFTAVNGPAAGFTSTDMNVQQSFSTPKGYSLQRVGTGDTAGDFVWSGPLPQTFNDINVGQRLLPLDDGSPEPLMESSPEGTLAASADAFINELHYRNEGKDQAEGVEVAAKAGTLLEGWKLFVYKASGNVQKYVPLAGTVPDMSNGWGVIFYPMPKFRQKPGIALVDCSGFVVEFLSPMISIVAKDGPANNSVSTNIGVQEVENTPPSDSLQRVGKGSKKQDFMWIGPTAQSFGTINVGQQFTE